MCDFEGEFSTFWTRYPLKVGKKAALKAYQARRRAGATAEEILEGLTRYLAFKKATGERHHNPATFLGPNEWVREPWTIPEAEAAPERKGNGEILVDGKFKRVWKPEIRERQVAASAGGRSGNLAIKLPGAGS